MTPVRPLPDSRLSSGLLQDEESRVTQHAEHGRSEGCQDAGEEPVVEQGAAGRLRGKGGASSWGLKVGHPVAPVTTLLCLSPALHPAPERGPSDPQRQHAGSEPALSGLSAVATVSGTGRVGGHPAPCLAALVDWDPVILLQLKAVHWYWVFAEGPGTLQHLPGAAGVTTQSCSELLCDLLNPLQGLL